MCQTRPLLDRAQARALTLGGGCCGVPPPGGCDPPPLDASPAQPGCPDLPTAAVARPLGQLFKDPRPTVKASAGPATAAGAAGSVAATLLSAGTAMGAAWPALGRRLAAVEHTGARVLVECWLLIAAALFVGQCCAWWLFSRWRPVYLVSSAKPVAGTQVNAAALVSDGACCKAKEARINANGNDSSKCTDQRAQQQQCQVKAAGVTTNAVSTQQAVEAALQQLHRAVGEGSGDASSHQSEAAAAAALQTLAETLFASPYAAAALAAAGGVDAVCAAAEAAAAAAADDAASETAAAAFSAMLQASWVLLQLANDGPRTRRALAGPTPMRAIAAMLAASLGNKGPCDTVRGPSPACAGAIARNVAATALLLTERVTETGCGSRSSSWDSRQPNQAAAIQAGDALQAAGMLPLLSLAAGFDGPGGALAAAPAAGALAAVALSQAGALSAAALELVLSPPVLHGAALLFSMRRQQCVQQQQQQQQQQRRVSIGATGRAPAGGSSSSSSSSPLMAAPGAARALELLGAALAHAATVQPEAAARALIEEQLLGPLLSVAPRSTARLLLAAVLSSSGARAIAAVEADWALDVPIALAEAVTLPASMHFTIPNNSAALSSVVGEDSSTTAQQLGAGAASCKGGRTDALAARLLLRGPRLRELVEALGEAAASEAAADCSCSSTAESAEAASRAARSLMGLVAWLVSTDPSADCRGFPLPGANSPAAGRGGSSSDCDSSDAVNDAADSSGVGSDQDPVNSVNSPLAALPSDAVFSFGAETHRMPAAAYHRLRRTSRLAHSLLPSAPPPPTDGPVSIFGVPGLSDSASCWALTRLEAWAAAGGCCRAASSSSSSGAAAPLAGLRLCELGQLWVAADFWAADGLQATCEDQIVAGLEGPAANGIALMCANKAAGNSDDGSGGFWQRLGELLELCAAHPAASGRLCRLAARAFARRAAAAAATAALPSMHLSAAQPARCLPAAMAAVVAAHRATLLPAFWDELRDRLVALVVLDTAPPDCRQVPAADDCNSWDG